MNVHLLTSASIQPRLAPPSRLRLVTFFLSWSGRDFRYLQFLKIWSGIHATPRTSPAKFARLYDSRRSWTSQAWYSTWLLLLPFYPELEQFFPPKESHAACRLPWESMLNHLVLIATERNFLHYYWFYIFLVIVHICRQWHHSKLSVFLPLVFVPVCARTNE